MPPPSALTRDAILEIARELPPGPRALAGLHQRLSHPDCPLDEVAVLVKQDAALAAHLIRTSNSVVFGGEQRAGSVEEAVGRVGFAEVYRLAGFLVSAQLVDRPLQHYGVEVEQLRDNMLQTAFLCERLAEACGLDGRVAYTAGLMRTIGMMVLDRIADRWQGQEPYHPAHDADYLSWEARQFGFGAAEISSWILTEWGFPDDIVRGVRGQYLIHPDDRTHPLALVLNLSGCLVAAAQLGLLGEARHWGHEADKAARLGLAPERLRALAVEGRQAMERFQRRVRGEAEVVEVAPAAPVPEPAPTGAPDSAENCNLAAAGGVLSPQHEPSEPTETAGAMTPVDFTTFMRNYQDMVYTTAVRLLGNEAQAEDISQEVFLKAYERFDDLSTSPTAGGWLKTVTTNMSINHLQRYRKRWRFFSELVRQDDEGEEAPVEFAAPDSDFLTGLNQSDRRAWVEDALAKLPQHQRVPLVLFHFEDLPYDEIARRLKVSLAKVKTDILRGRSALAQILARSGTPHEALQPEF